MSDLCSSATLCIKVRRRQRTERIRQLQLFDPPVIRSEVLLRFQARRMRRKGSNGNSELSWMLFVVRIDPLTGGPFYYSRAHGLFTLVDSQIFHYVHYAYRISKVTTTARSRPPYLPATTLRREKTSPIMIVVMHGPCHRMA